MTILIVFLALGGIWAWLGISIDEMAKGAGRLRILAAVFNGATAVGLILFGIGYYIGFIS